jgi:RimJ/RimL family protein N-acetyltransferase
MGMLNIRKLNSTDYENILVGWWKDWGWAPPQKDFLPEDGEGGIIILDGEIPICAGFMYITNSKVAWVDWIISSKTYNEKPFRKEAIKLLISSLTKFCKDTGNKYTYALIKNQSLIKVYEELGYTKGDNYTTEMIKLL